MRSQMMRVISSPSSSTTGLATLILSIKGSSEGASKDGEGVAIAGPQITCGPRPVKGANGSPCRHSFPPSDGGKYRRRGPGDEEFRLVGPAANRAPMRLAQRASPGAGLGCG